MAEVERGLLTLMGRQKESNEYLDRIRNEYRRELGLYGRCDCCGMDKDLCQDHDHINGLNRGKICQACNSGLGFFRDDVRRLILAEEYLRRWQDFHFKLSRHAKQKHRHKWPKKKKAHGGG